MRLVLTDILMSYIDNSPNEQDKWQLVMRCEENSLDATELGKLTKRYLKQVRGSGRRYRTISRTQMICLQRFSPR